MRVRGWFVLSAVLAACASAAPPPPVEVDIARPKAAASAPPAASVAPVDEAPSDEPKVDCSDAVADAARDRMNRARAVGELGFRQRTVEDYLFVRPEDASARHELATVLTARGEAAEAATQATLALALGTTETSSAWRMVGRAADEAKDREHARAAYARALSGDPAAKALLAGRSTCPGALFRGAKTDGLTIVKSWLELFDVVEPARSVHEELPAPATEADARKRVCIATDLDSIVARDVCDGAGPWHVLTGHLHFHDHVVIIVPVLGGRFAVVPYTTGVPCRGGSSSKARALGDVVEVKSEVIDVLQFEQPCADGAHDALVAACISGAHVETDYFDARTGVALAVIEEPKAREKHDVKGGKLRRRAKDGCDESIDLRRLPKTVAARPLGGQKRPHPRPLSPKGRGELSGIFRLQNAYSHTRAPPVRQAGRTTIAPSSAPLSRSGRGAGAEGFHAGRTLNLAVER
jgi:hypothetical protein